MKRIIFSLFLLFFFLSESSAGVVNSKHNLSAESGNEIRATSETQVCKFCHIPHGKHSTFTSHTTNYPYYEQMYPGPLGSPKPAETFRLPLFSHQLTTSLNAARVSFSSGLPHSDDYTQGLASLIRISTYAYGPFDDIFLNPGPDNIEGTDDDTMEIDWVSSGASRMCFSCHDGTIRIGAVYNSAGTISYIDMDNAAAGNKLTDEDKLGPGAEVRYLPPDVDDNQSFGRKHSADHAFYSFYMTEEVRQSSPLQGPPFTLGRSLLVVDEMRNKGALDRNNFVQCTACHDPHQGTPASWGNQRQFWRYPNNPDGPCLDCHP